MPSCTLQRNKSRNPAKPPPGRRWSSPARAWRAQAALCLLLAFASAGTALAQVATPTARIPLWPGTAPGSEEVSLVQRTVERSSDPSLPDRYVEAVSVPELLMYRPQRPDGRALLVIPGGGYQRVVLDKEGSALVPTFADDAGLTVFVLQYRLPGEGHRDARDVPLADAQRAMRIIRARASEWGIDAAGVGVMGFSAGGHVAASLATRHAEPLHAPVDAVDGLPARPAYAVLVYPVIDMGDQAHAGSRARLLGAVPDPASVQAYSLQHRVDEQTPPVFLLHAQDDAVVKVENSLLFEAALREAGVEHETHLYAHGGHGFGVREARGTLALWPALAIAWIRAHSPLPATRTQD